jgi:hypothetical protein
MDLDSAAFGVKFAAHLWSHLDALDRLGSGGPRLGSGGRRGAAFYKKWLPSLLTSMEATTKDPEGSGLLWSNTSRPMVGYGFQDAETKSGAVLYSSVLYWNASRLIGAMATKQGK